MEPVSIGVIGGSGLYKMEGIEILDEIRVETPFGDPSDAIILAKVGDRRVAFLPRHGRGHRHNPTKVPYRANIWALKSLGVFWCVTVSAVGSLREEIVPEHFVIPDQIIDRTRHRVGTFFDDIAVHVAFAHPFNEGLRQILLAACKEEGVTTHDGGTYVCMEGPLFSTRAESLMHKSWGASLIGMTALPEAKLAREAEMAYATIALATDYDCWHDDHDEVSVDQVIGHIQNNVANVQRVLKRIIPSIPLGSESDNEASRALASAVMTAPHLIPESTWEAFGPWLSKYMERPST